jgi:DNA-directed RNA polymerase subunit delta
MNMADIKVKVAYLNGLAEGLGINKDTKEGQVLLGIMDVLNDISDEIEQLHVEQADLEDYVKAVDEDLVDLEDEVYEVDEDEDDLIELECPECGQLVYVRDDFSDDEVPVELMCPSCGFIVYSSAEEEPDDEIEYPEKEEKFSLED